MLRLLERAKMTQDTLMVLTKPSLTMATYTSSDYGRATVSQITVNPGDLPFPMTTVAKVGGVEVK
jgi:hypothetical protein